MSTLSPYAPMDTQQPAHWPGQQDSRESEHGSDLLPLLALTALGLGLLAAWYIGPDLKRYLRIRNM